MFKYILFDIWYFVGVYVYTVFETFIWYEEENLGDIIHQQFSKMARIQVPLYLSILCTLYNVYIPTISLQGMNPNITREPLIATFSHTDRRNPNLKWYVTHIQCVKNSCNTFNACVRRIQMTTFSQSTAIYAYRLIVWYAGVDCCVRLLNRNGRFNFIVFVWVWHFLCSDIYHWYVEV